METDPCSVEAVWKDRSPPAGWGLQRAWVSWPRRVWHSQYWFSPSFCERSTVNVLQNTESLSHTPTHDFTFVQSRFIGKGICRFQPFLGPI